MPKDRAETAQLQREIVSVVVHDLGSIAGALGLRAALPAPVDAAAHERQQEAMRELSRQLRAAMQLLELARMNAAPRLGNTTATSIVGVAPALSPEAWAEQLQTLARSLLPRGTTFVVAEGEPPHGGLTPMAAYDTSVLTQLIQAAWRGLVSPRNAAPSPSRISLSLSETLVMTAVLSSDIHGADALKWKRFSERVAAESGYQVHWWDKLEHGAAEGHTLFSWSCARVPSVPV